MKYTEQTVRGGIESVHIYDFYYGNYIDGNFHVTTPRGEIYFVNRKLHRDDGPAIISYLSSYKKAAQEERYFINGKKVKEILYKYNPLNPSKDIHIISHYDAGRLHSDIGAAYIVYDDPEKPIYEQYYLRGKRIEKRLWEKLKNGSDKSVELDRIMEKYGVDINKCSQVKIDNLIKKTNDFEKFLEKYRKRY